MPIKSLDDIERERHKETREKIKREVTEDVSEVLGNIGLIRKPKNKKTIIDYLYSALKILGIIILLLFVINLFLGNVWLLRFFIKSLFLGR